MSCLERFLWTKLPRSVVPSCKGILSHWAHLAARAAFRKGIVSYCGHRNPVEPGTWAGGIVGLKSILGVKSVNRHSISSGSSQILGISALNWTLKPRC